VVLKILLGDFSLEDEPRAEHPQNIERDELQAMLDINPVQTVKELVQQLDITQQVISTRLHAMGKVQKEGRWVPHALSEDNKNRLCDIALTLLSMFRNRIFCTK